ncbi:protein kinase [Streptomyces sp. NA04227]|uniref:serine/threonine-protein kinase n=1 Tax=Streptomyces sp. NA04227 TaxID=2742136 RepID=UPI0015914F98|nr:serine/threonine-protein kinase [Streptomyces sp. NA04227]QKW05228.1 protein kinase [Streptomyces sp. NA04227]
MTTGEYEEAPGVGRLLAGRYRTVRRLGRGGMGVVWQATDEVLGREVAVKELRTYTDSAGPELADMQLRMQREARAAARVRHPSVIAVHDVTQVDGRPLIVMELVDGPSLDDVLQERGTLDPREAAAIGADVLDALAAAHAVGVLHRDVKPGNILLDRSGRRVLTDFGIATMDDPGDGSATHLTRSGEIVGSLDYLAPERAQGQQPGPASDIWAVGATLYAAVEGASPFRRTSTWSTLSAIVAEPLPVPQRAGVLMPVLEELMHKEPGMRPDAARAAALLREVATGGTAEAATAPQPSTGVPPAGVGPAGGYGYPAAVPGQAPQSGAPLSPAGPVSAGGYGYPAASSAHGAPSPGPSYGAPAAGFGYGGGPAAGAPAPGHVGAPGQAAGAQVYGAGQFGGPGPQPQATRDTARESRGRRKRGSALLAGVAVAVVLAATGVGVALMGGSDGEQDEAGPAGGGTPVGSTSEPSAEGSRGSIGGDKDPDSGGRPSEEPDSDAETGPGDSASPSDKPDPKPKPSDAEPDPTTGPTTDPGGEPSAPAPVCADIGGGKFNCEVWRAAKSYNGAGAEVGVLKAGTNYFYCQQNLGRRETAGEWTNVWSAKTDDDSGNAGVWVNVVNIKGGANDAPLPGLPYC